MSFSEITSLSAMASTAHAPIKVSIETGLPNSGDVTIRIGPEAVDDLRRAFGELGLPTADALEHSAPEVLTAIFEVQNVLGSAGLVALAKGLSIWLHRNDGKEIDATVNGAKLRLKGMSEAEIVRILSELRTERDGQWRSQFPDRFPPGLDEEL
jgi:hypothetical protein